VVPLEGTDVELSFLQASSNNGIDVAVMTNLLINFFLCIAD
jgi:hypothetical protein